MSLATHPNIIAELFQYFAKFPKRDNILKRFRKRPGETNFEPYYSDMKAYIVALPEGSHSLCPGIDDIVFSAVGEEYIKKQIEDMDGKVFMVLDYGNITANEGTGQVPQRSEIFDLSIVVGQQYKPEDMDAIEHAALSDKMLNNIRCIRDQLRADDATCGGSEDKINFPHQILPFYARNLQNTIGWTLLFSQRTIDLL